MNKKNGISKQDVINRVPEDSNPVLKGLYADPELALFNGKYYIYPTTDGYPGWSGYQFKVFSSENLRDWKEEGIILDLKGGQVPWAAGSAWAPAIAEKCGIYYFYFCGKRADGISCIGVAKANNPTGPFKAEKLPLITPEAVKAEGREVSQVIDPSVYIEEDGVPYLLFGNGKGAIVQLNNDMVSFCPGTMKNIEGLTDFREAVTVLKREGKYHFTWSCDDTGSENYHVNYGTSDSLSGPVGFHYIILEKRPEKSILGTGHHSIMKVQDKYIIAYHRFATPLGKYSEGKGYHREVCLDFINFNKTGYMEKIDPTR